MTCLTGYCSNDVGEKASCIVCNVMSLTDSSTFSDKSPGTRLETNIFHMICNCSNYTSNTRFKSDLEI